MESQTGRDNGKAILRFKVMIINTAELKKVLEDADFDGITLQLTQAIGNLSAGNNASDGKHTFGFIAYKHYSSKKKQEQITDPKFFADNNKTEIFKDVEIGGDGVMSNFGNLKLTRGDMKEDVDTIQYPYLVLSPEHGTGEHENYIVCKAFYTDKLNDSPAPAQSLSRGMTPVKPFGINPSPPA